MKVVKKELVNDDEVSEAGAIKHAGFRFDTDSQWQSGVSWAMLSLLKSQNKWEEMRECAGFLVVVQ